MTLGPYVRLPDADRPIYRILPVRYFEQMLSERTLFLSNPSRWDDPFEVIASPFTTIQRLGAAYKHATVEAPVHRVFAQCWSAMPPSDTLLRAYSRVVKDARGRNSVPDEEGVRIRSTPRRLLAAVAPRCAESSSYCWIGAVEYVDQEALLQRLANAIGGYGAQVFHHHENLARLALLKRSAFSHEAEVRLVVITSEDAPRTKSFEIPADPNHVIDEISFDPRLAIGEQRERAARARELGYTGSVFDWDLYQRVIVQVQLPSEETQE